MGKKVLVRSRHREVTVRTSRDLARDKDNKVVESNVGYRQFINHVAYMSMTEAAELVDSLENKRHIDAGLPPIYYYPAGMPVPVDENHEGVLSPPLSGEGLVANNPAQNEAARRVNEEADRQIRARQRNSAAAAKSEESEARKIEEKPLPVAGAPVRIANPDAPGDSDTLADVPRFRDTKAAEAKK